MRHSRASSPGIRTWRAKSREVRFCAIPEAGITRRCSASDEYGRCWAKSLEAEQGATQKPGSNQRLRCLNRAFLQFRRCAIQELRFMSTMFHMRGAKTRACGSHDSKSRNSAQQWPLLRVLECPARSPCSTSGTSRLRAGRWGRRRPRRRRLRWQRSPRPAGAQLRALRRTRRRTRRTPRAARRT